MLTKAAASATYLAALHEGALAHLAPDDPERATHKHAYILVRTDAVRPDPTVPRQYIVQTDHGLGTYDATTWGCDCHRNTNGEDEPRCAHILAVRLWCERRNHMDALFRDGVVHRHRYTCGMATGWVECWQQACGEGDILCPHCQRETARPTAPEAPMCGQCWLEHGHDQQPCYKNCGCHDGYSAIAAQDETVPAPPLDYAREQYEPNPEGERVAGPIATVDHMRLQLPPSSWVALTHDLINLNHAYRLQDLGTIVRVHWATMPSALRGPCTDYEAEDADTLRVWMIARRATQ